MQNKKIFNILQIVFVVMLLIEGYLQTSCYTFGNKVISFVIWPMVLIGTVLIIYNLIKAIKDKQFINDKKNWLLILFVVSFLISTFVMREYGIYKNIRTLFFIVFQCFILYLYDNKDDNHESKINIYLITFLLGTFILSLISMVHLATGYSKYVLNNNSPHLVYGFTWGRLFGAYWDPNIASVICSLSLIIIIDIFKKIKKNYQKILLSLYFLMQLLYIVFSDSRTGRICLVVSITSYIVFKFIQLMMNGKYKDIKKFYIKMMVSILLGIFLTISIPIGIKYTYNELVTITENEKVTITKNKKIKKSKSKKDKSTIGRGYDLGNDISNKRFGIWNSGLKIFERNILTGVSRANIVAYALKVMPKTYIVNNTQMHFNSMHNLYVDILVSQGLLGFVPFILFMILSAVNILKNLKKILIKSKYSVMFLSILLTVLTSSLVMTEIIYVDSPNSTLFWICLGYLNYLCIKEKE